MRPLILAVLLSACATPGFKGADCDRFRFSGYNILACDDVAVGAYCAKGGRDLVKSHVRAIPLADNGKVVDYAPRACFNPRGNAFGRKGNIIVGKSFMTAIPHELCHVENPGNPAMCEKLYPVVGDRRTK